MHQSREQKLADFVEWSSRHIRGDEKSEAQIFLDRMFQAFGQPGLLDVGGQPEYRVRKSKDDGGGTAFADYVWKPVVLIEMKKRGQDLLRHYRQAFDYWVRLAPNRPKYVVLSNFDEFWIYDFDSAQIDTPMDKVSISDLTKMWGALAFLFPTNEKPVFGNDHEAVTRATARNLANCFNKLVKRKIERPLAQKFVLQMLVSLFAEDIGLLQKYTITQLLDDCRGPRDTYDLLGGLFVEMNTPGTTPGGRYKGVPYFNGGLFAEPARIELASNELNELQIAARADWSQVRPEIFGTLFEHSLNSDERHASGAHFTSPNDIMKIVIPTITRPWSEAIEAAKSLPQLQALLHQLHEFRVLDPSCGSGNFLYLAYREMKRLEARIYERQNEFPQNDPMQKRLGYVFASQFFGLDINAFAIELAKVTMMIARKLAIDELHVSEDPLPLDNLDGNFQAVDALVDSAGNATQWPAADVIIGNPPYLDARRMTKEFGRKYVAQLQQIYPEVPRRADHCTYWIRRSHDHLPDCTRENPMRGRAGLVGTQNIRNNQSRIGGLDHVVETGTIVEAVDNQPWSGEAVVHVSIVNWMKTKDPALMPKRRILWTKAAQLIDEFPRQTNVGKSGNSTEMEMRECDQINSALSDGRDVSQAEILLCNRQPKRCFEGQQPGHKGFRLSFGEKSHLAAKEDIKKIVFPFLNGDDLLSAKYHDQPEYIVDFGNRDMLEAASFPKTFDLLRDRVLPEWSANAVQEQAETGKASGEHQGRLKKWWQLKRRRGELIDVITALPRYTVCVRHTKRPIFVFLNSKVRPDSALTCFALADDYSFGVLQSNAHWQWFITKCSKLKSDFRYTPDSVFDTFPWPQSPSAKKVRGIADAACQIRNVRKKALAKLKGGLRELYRTLELPGDSPLKDAHARLDAAVLDAYGFTSDDLLTQLLALNSEIAARISRGESVTAPGVPGNYPHPESLITEDCITP